MIGYRLLSGIHRGQSVLSSFLFFGKYRIFTHPNEIRLEFSLFTIFSYRTTNHIVRRKVIHGCLRWQELGGFGEAIANFLFDSLRFLMLEG